MSYYYGNLDCPWTLTSSGIVPSPSEHIFYAQGLVSAIEVDDTSNMNGSGLIENKVIEEATAEKPRAGATTREVAESSSTFLSQTKPKQDSKLEPEKIAEIAAMVSEAKEKAAEAPRVIVRKYEGAASSKGNETFSKALKRAGAGAVQKEKPKREKYEQYLTFN
jgi:hypothetical protein